MSGNSEKSSKIPVLKSPGKKSKDSANNQAVLGQVEKQSDRTVVDDKFSYRKTPADVSVPASTREECSTRIAASIPFPAKTDTSFFFGEDWKTKDFSPISLPTRVSFSEKYQKDHWGWAGHDAYSLMDKELDEKRRAKKKRVAQGNGRKIPETHNAIDLYNMDDVQLLQEYENEIAMAIEDCEKKNIQDSFEESLDFQHYDLSGVNNVEMPCPEENQLCPEIPEFDLMDPNSLAFEEVEAGEPEDEHFEEISENPLFDDIVDVHEYQEIERKILNAYESRHSSIKIPAQKNQKSNLKLAPAPASSSQLSSDVKMSRKNIPPKRKREERKLKNNPSYVKMDVNISSPLLEDEPEGINDVQQPAELDFVISDPVIPKMHSRQSDEQNSEEAVGACRLEDILADPVDPNQIKNCPEVATSSREENPEPEKKEIDKDGELRENIQTTIDNSHKSLTEVEKTMERMTDIVLGMLITLIILAMAYFGWTLLVQHSEQIQPHKEPTFMESVENFLQHFNFKL